MEKLELALRALDDSDTTQRQAIEALGTEIQRQGHLIAQMTSRSDEERKKTDQKFDQLLSAMR